MNKLYNDSHKDTYFALWQDFDPILLKKKIQLEQYRAQHYLGLVLTAKKLIGDEEDRENYLLVKFLKAGSATLDAWELEHFHKVFTDKDFMPTKELSQESSDSDYLEWFYFITELELDFVRNTKLTLECLVKEEEELESLRVANLCVTEQSRGLSKRVSFNCKPLDISSDGYLHLSLEKDGSYQFSYELYELKNFDQQAETSGNFKNFLYSLSNAGIKELDLTAPELNVWQVKQNAKNNVL